MKVCGSYAYIHIRVSKLWHYYYMYHIFFFCWCSSICYWQNLLFCMNTFIGISYAQNRRENDINNMICINCNIGQKKSFHFFLLSNFPRWLWFFFLSRLLLKWNQSVKTRRGEGGGDEDKYALATSHVPLRGHPHMLSATFSGFWIFSPLSVSHPGNLPSLGQKLANPSPSVQTSYMPDHLCQSLLSLPLPIPVLSILPIYYERSC